MNKMLLLQFEANIRSISGLGGIYHTLESSTTNVLDISDILRSELVLAVATLDQFIHSLVTEGMIEIYQNQRPATQGYNNFRISMRDYNKAIQNPNNPLWLRHVISQHNRLQTFQRAKQISAGLRSILEKDVWEEISKLMSYSATDIQEELNIIVDKRNTIVHSYDMKPDGGRWPIDFQLVQKSVSFINEIGNKIFTVVN